MASWPHKNSPDEIRFRQDRLRALPGWDEACDVALDWPSAGSEAAFARTLEGLTGYAAIPVGVIGPLALDMGEYELDPDGRLIELGRRRDEVFVPLAHTEGGLSASMHRGARAARMAGGVRTYVLADRITRDSCFIFETTGDALALARWVERNAAAMGAWLAGTENPLCGRTAGGVGLISGHARLREVDSYVLGTTCHVLYRFTTGDACGPNMMTRNAHALNRWFVCERFGAETGLRPRRVFLEANMGGDKKPSFQYFQQGHGKTVLAEATLPDAVLRRVLHVAADDLYALQVAGLHGSHASGMQSMAFTPASAVAALFAATGQDLGMVGTSSMALTVVEPTPAGLHVSLRLPGLEVGTVGGGTSLPHARAWLRTLGCDGPGRVYRFAQIVAAAALCLELSAASSMAVAGSENFYRAHLERGGLRLMDSGGGGGASR